jgi:large subunit ribosomal protein L29
MKPQEIRSFDDERIDTELQNAYKELFNLRFQQALGRLTNPARFKQIRKDIARLKTIQRERELDAEASA